MNSRPNFLLFLLDGMQAATIDYNEFVGRIAIGRISRGSVKKGEQLHNTLTRQQLLERLLSERQVPVVYVPS